MSNYVVGDIQGCYDELQRLLDRVNFNPLADRLWCVGDMVNRGPQSLETLRFLKSLGASFTGVLGNHDLHFLAVASGAYTQGKITSLLPLLNAPDCAELFDWVRGLPLAHREKLATDTGTRKFLMVHAGIPPGWKFKQTIGYANEVEQVLRSPDYLPFLTAMYGDKPDTWSESLKGLERLRVITNSLTRMRFCSPEGKLNFSAKGDVSQAPVGFKPWFRLHKLKPDKTILFGHWATIDGVTGIGNIQGLDTGCVWGRAMTLLHLESGERKQISCILR